MILGIVASHTTQRSMAINPTDNKATKLSRGIGIYPGNPDECHAPVAIKKQGELTDMARLRAAHASSAFDYNLTAQLATDGMATTCVPPLLNVSNAQGPLPRREREWAIDGGDFTRNTLMGSNNFLQYDWTGMSVDANRIGVVCQVAYNEKKNYSGYSIRLLCRKKDKKGNISKKWTVIAQQRGDSLPGLPLHYKMHSDPNKQTDSDLLPARQIKALFNLPDNAGSISNLRVELAMDGAAYWRVFNVDFYNDDKRITTDVLPLSHFGSAWVSDGEGKQWIETDLGHITLVESVELDWIRRPQQLLIQTSDDNNIWRTVAEIGNGKKSDKDIISTPGAEGRYIRVAMDGGSEPVVKGAENMPAAYALSEMRVMGYNNIAWKPSDVALCHDGKMSLNGGEWRLQRVSIAGNNAHEISSNSYTAAKEWIAATVPGTVLTSFVNTGAVPDPNIADNLFQISDSYFYSDFWYRRVFKLPKEMRRRHVMLNLDGINWKAEVWLNGSKIGNVEGAFARGKFDITKWLADGDNTLAIKIIKNEHPGAVKEKNQLNTDFNGGILGMDNPTFHASTGWDWISTVRGRNIGIWNDVYLSAADNVVLSDPVCTTLLALPDTTATITPRVMALNVLDKEVKGVLKGWIGDISVEQHVTLTPHEQREIVFEPEAFPTLAKRHMRLWWPNGYGEPYLYNAGFEFCSDSDSTIASLNYKTGIRQMTYADAATQLKLFVNGRRFIPLGGNWGFSENNLNFRQREYDIALNYHRQMNFNMVRNWVGMIGDEEFYDACDRNGIMVWQDFWLANPADGANPKDERMFMDNARDFTRRMRQHPSIALYCGRNEGYPPKSLDNALRHTVDSLNPGLLYISSSADEGVSGHGPYWACAPRTYFEGQTGKLHTEKGMPNIMSPEGLERTIAPNALWPQGDAWGQHDFTQQGAQRGASFDAMLSHMFGNIDNARDFATLAQWINYDGYRAMFESGAQHRQGLLIWMSHACWPSLTWQCYDYFFEPTAAFFACRKACEPLHIQWNASTRDVEVMNLCAGDKEQLTATREILDMYGNVVNRMSVPLEFVANDSTLRLNTLHVDSLPTGVNTGVYYVRLQLSEHGGNILSNNFYVLSADEGNLQQLRQLPTAHVVAKERYTDGNTILLTLKNTSDVPAMMTRLNLKTPDNLQVLPVDYSDNYFHLMPGEEKTINITWHNEDTRRLSPHVEITGLNF